MPNDSTRQSRPPAPSRLWVLLPALTSLALLVVTVFNDGGTPATAKERIAAVAVFLTIVWMGLALAARRRPVGADSERSLVGRPLVVGRVHRD